jgi:predicted house-cleaning noncanonical NTP pyrophosphatase (MazG superfamily)
VSKIVYNKLVRDKIPEIIRADGKEPKTRILDDTEYLESLLRKLEEECKELAEDRNADELADVHEVLIALAEALHITPAELEKVRKDKAAKRGGFQEKIFLESVDETD